MLGHSCKIRAQQHNRNPVEEKEIKAERRFPLGFASSQSLRLPSTTQLTRLGYGAGFPVYGDSREWQAQESSNNSSMMTTQRHFQTGTLSRRKSDTAPIHVSGYPTPHLLRLLDPEN